MPEITNPKAILVTIRNAIDALMSGGEEIVATSGVRVNLRGLLGECDLLFPFIHPARCPTPFDWAELQSLRRSNAQLRDYIANLEDQLERCQ